MISRAVSVVAIFLLARSSSRLRRAISVYSAVSSPIFSLGFVAAAEDAGVALFTSFADQG
jgi:hypothetical protein